MEIAHMRSLPEFGMEDPCFILNSLDDMSSVSIAASFGESLNHSYTHPMFDLKTCTEPSHTTTAYDRPVKLLKTNSWNSSITDQITSNPQVISSPNQIPFQNSNYAAQVQTLKPKEELVSFKNVPTLPSHEGSFGNQNYVFKPCQGAKRISTNNRLSSSQEHIIAERKRREKLSQQFIALSAIIPGLKKTDKASILVDAIKYLKQLQDRVKTLEEQARKRSVESVVFVKKLELQTDGSDDSSPDKNFYDEPLPEIEARVCDKNVLIRVHCEKRKGIIERTVAEIQKLHLSIVNSSVVSFGSSILDITIVAQMDVEFNMTVKDLVTNLHEAFKLFM